MLMHLVIRPVIPRAAQAQILDALVLMLAEIGQFRAEQKAAHKKRKSKGKQRVEAGKLSNTKVNQPAPILPPKCHTLTLRSSKTVSIPDHRQPVKMLPRPRKESKIPAVTLSNDGDMPSTKPAVSAPVILQHITVGINSVAQSLETFIYQRRQVLAGQHHIRKAPPTLKRALPKTTSKLTQSKQRPPVKSKRKSKLPQTLALQRKSGVYRYLSALARSSLHGSKPSNMVVASEQDARIYLPLRTVGSTQERPNMPAVYEEITGDLSALTAQKIFLKKACPTQITSGQVTSGVQLKNTVMITPALIQSMMPWLESQDPAYFKSYRERDARLRILALRKTRSNLKKAQRRNRLERLEYEKEQQRIASLPKAASAQGNGELNGHDAAEGSQNAMDVDVKAEPERAAAVTTTEQLPSDVLPSKTSVKPSKPTPIL